MSLIQTLRHRIAERLEKHPEDFESIITKEEAREIYAYDADVLLELAGTLRKFYFKNYVFVHVLNNIKNGNCSEDCGYCAQRKNAEGIPKYTLKTEEEILQEAKIAKENGAHRYCLVTSGRGINPGAATRYAKIIRRIREEVGIKVCLSAGIVQNPETARILAEAGLDRYNHNLNTSRNHYRKITTTHTYEDREMTLQNVSSQSIGLCSGVIVGMGETLEDRIDVAFRLNAFRVDSIPVNFFIPVPGHNVPNFETFTPEECLKILSLFRLINPRAEIRMAAGRELYLKDKQHLGLQVANSLFVSGYLNVRGSSAHETIKMIYENGYRLDPQSNVSISEFKDGIISEPDTSGNGNKNPDSGTQIQLKTIEELRPFYRRK